MEQLSETRNALQQILSDEQMRSGVHLADYVAIGVPGVTVGEVPFNPSMHSVSAINPMSLNEWSTDQYHVKQVVPFKSLEMNVILHRDPADRQMPQWLESARQYKHYLASSLADAVFDAKQVGDEANYYIIGDTQDREENNWNVEYISGTEDPVEAARTIEDICLRGLTFIVSDFNRLPLEHNAGMNRSLAIKSNHPYEIEVPKAKFALPLGGDRELRTWKSKELKQYNDDLEEKNLAIEQRLLDLGLRVSHDSHQGLNSDGYNMSSVDAVLASQLRSIQQS